MRNRCVHTAPYSPQHKTNTSLSSNLQLKTTLAPPPKLKTTLASTPKLKTTLASTPKLKTTLASTPKLKTTLASTPKLKTTLASTPKLSDGQLAGRGPHTARILTQVRNGSDRKGAGRVAFPPPKVGVTRTLPYPIRPHSGDCSVALAWANKEVETFVCILGEEDVVYDVYVAAAVIDIRPTTKGTVGSGNATSELSWANRSLPTAPLRSNPFRTLQWKCGISFRRCGC
ncbi:unnamed protein product [Boreogadus saida]